MKEPDLEKLGGKLLRSHGNQRMIELPVAAAKQLRRHEAVSTLQRLWAGEPLEELAEDPYESSATRGLETESDTNLDWGPKDYSYDKSGNITAIVSPAGTDSYSYDTAGRLIQATVGGKTETFKYDAFGNLIEKAIAGANPESVPTDGSSNRLIGATYDAAGNLTTRDGFQAYQYVPQEYGYDSFSMLQQTTLGYNIYDANDERIGVVSGSTGRARWWIRDLEGRVLREFTSNESFDYQDWLWQHDYVYAGGQLVGGEKLQWSYNPGEGTVYGGKRHYHLDHLGSVRMVTDDEGRSVSEHDYYAFGVSPTKAYQEELDSGNPSIDSMRFAGHQRDNLGWLNIENTEYLDYMHARFYDPNLGRFLSVDPGDDTDPAQPQSWNKYAYVRNNPVNATDPTGMAASFTQINISEQPATMISRAFFLGFMAAYQFDQWQQRAEARRLQSVLVQHNYIASFTGGQQFASYELCAAAFQCIDPEQMLGFVGGVARTSRAARLWTVTKAGTNGIRHHAVFGKISRHKSTGLWWSKDHGGHGPTWKVFAETPHGLQHIRDADQYGNFIVGKHKGPVGKFIPWSELGK